MTEILDIKENILKNIVLFSNKFIERYRVDNGDKLSIIENALFSGQKINKILCYRWIEDIEDTGLNNWALSIALSTDRSFDSFNIFCSENYRFGEIHNINEDYFFKTKGLRESLIHLFNSFPYLLNLEEYGK